MKIYNPLCIATAFIILLLQSLVLHGMDTSQPPTKTKGTPVKKTQTLKKEIEEEVPVPILPPDARPPLTSVKAELNPGFFFRTSDYKEMNGVYAKKAMYYSIDLFEKIDFMNAFIIKQTSREQYLGAVFFGVWRFPKDKKSTEENIDIIEVPLREVKDNEMFYKNQDQKVRPYPRLLWETGKGQERTEKDTIGESTLFYKILPCKGKHTEERFKMFIKDEGNKKALWKYFLQASEAVPLKNRKLDLVGFKFYSSLDSCDECFEKIYKLQANPEKVLMKLLPPEFLAQRRIPFQVLFNANSFYHPGQSGPAGASLYFYPRKIQPLISLGRYNGTTESYNCSALNRSVINEEAIDHQDEIKFIENQQLNYILFKIGDGAGEDITLKVSMHPCSTCYR